MTDNIYKYELIHLGKPDCSETLRLIKDTLDQSDWVISRGERVLVPYLTKSMSRAVSAGWITAVALRLETQLSTPMKITSGGKDLVADKINIVGATVTPTEQGGVDISVPLGGEAEMNYSTALDDVGGGISYIGYAVPGASTASAVWRVKKLQEFTDGDIVITWADGNDLFDNIWDNRLSLNFI